MSTTSNSQPVQVERYSLFTALCMIVGICIGSGIFFKTDNILVATGGNVALGVMMFVIASTTIVFGGLTLARFAAKTDGHGGPIAYAEKFLGPHRLTFIGWHFTFLYFPVVTAIVCWVVGVYATMSFGLPTTFGAQMLVGLLFMLACFAWNVLWPKLGGYLQNATTLAKVLPLVVVGIVGMLFADPVATLAAGAKAAPAAGLGWVAAAAPIAFAFDGWSAAAGIAPELKNAKRNLPLALTLGPLLILVLYVAYFLGVSCYLGPEQVMAAGDASLSLLFAKLFGPGAAALPNVIALIAVAGTANGLILTYLRMPFAMALHDEMPCSKRVRRINPTLNFPLASALVALGMTLFWFLVHYVVTTLGLLPNGDISEVGVSMTLLILPVFYIEALLHDPAGEFHGSKRVVRAIAPVAALVSSLAIGLSSISDPSRWPFVAAHVAVLAIATLLVQRKFAGNGKKTRAAEA